MKKIFIGIIAGIMATMLLTACGGPNYTPEEAIIVDKKIEESNAEKWTKYVYYGSAYEKVKESYYWHLDQGETVSEIIEYDENGRTVYMFKVKVAG